MNTAVEVKNLTKVFRLPHDRSHTLKQTLLKLGRKRTYEELKALDDVTFEVKEGEFFGIVGRNGSGKSTLLKILAGIYTPTSGTVKVNGRLTPFIELGIGFNPELTGRENIFLNGSILGLTEKEVAEKYDEIVAFSELERFMDQKLKNYSSGMQVRLAFSIAIQAQNEILLIDEVLAVGDAVFQRKCFEYFRELKRRGTTVIFVSHDIETVSRYCDRGTFLHNGRVIKTGKIRLVINEYRRSLISYKERTAEAATAGETRQKIIKISDCNISNLSHEPTRKFNSGEGVLIDLELEINSKIKTPLNAAIGIYDVDGAYAFGASTQIDGLELPNNTRKVALTIQNPHLKNGHYLIYASVFGESEGAPYDYVPEITSFEIEGAPDLKSRGAIMAEHKWSYQ